MATINGFAHFKDPGAGVMRCLGGDCVADDGTTTISVSPVTTELDVDINTSGAGGLDTGSPAYDTLYATWAIDGAEEAPTLLASLSFTAPTMPTGYTAKRRVGSGRTRRLGTGGSPDTVVWHAFQGMNTGNNRWNMFTSEESQRTVLDGGTATALTAVALDHWCMNSQYDGQWIELYFFNDGTADVEIKSKDGASDYVLFTVHAGESFVRKVWPKRYAANDMRIYYGRVGSTGTVDLTVVVTAYQDNLALDGVG